MNAGEGGGSFRMTNVSLGQATLIVCDFPLYRNKNSARENGDSPRSESKRPQATPLLDG